MTVGTVGIALCLVLAALPAEAQSRRPGPRAAGARKDRPALERFHQLSPADRRKALDKLPPDRRRIAEDRLEDYERLGEQERKRLADRHESFQKLSPDAQEAVRQSFRQFNSLPAARRKIVGEELRHLSGLPEPERRGRMNSDEFRNQFNSEERQILESLVVLNPGP